MVALKHGALVADLAGDQAAGKAKAKTGIVEVSSAKIWLPLRSISVLSTPASEYAPQPSCSWLTFLLPR